MSPEEIDAFLTYLAVLAQDYFYGPEIPGFLYHGCEDLWFSATDGGDIRLSIDVSMNHGNQVLGFQWHYKTNDRNIIFVILNYEESSLSLKPNSSPAYLILESRGIHQTHWTPSTQRNFT